MLPDTSAATNMITHSSPHLMKQLLIIHKNKTKYAENIWRYSELHVLSYISEDIKDFTNITEWNIILQNYYANDWQDRQV